jgi:hypothetical protein
LLIGLVLTFVGGLAASFTGSVGNTDRTAWVLLHLPLVLGAAATLLGLPATYAAQSERVGITGVIGFGMLFIGFLGLGFFISTVQLLLLPWVYDRGSCALGCHLLSTSDGPPLVGAFYLIEQLATFVGLILLGLATARAAVFARPAGYLMALAGVVGLPLIWINVPSNVGFIPEALGTFAVGWMAVQLISDSGSADM